MVTVESAESAYFGQGQDSTVNFRPESAPQLGLGECLWLHGRPPKGGSLLWVPVDLLGVEGPFSLVFIL